MSLLPLVRIEGTLNSKRYISGVLGSVALPFVPALLNAMFKLDNARMHVDGIVLICLERKHIQLLPWRTRSPDFSPIQNVGPRFPSDGFVTTRQSLWLVIYATVLKLHRQLYLYMPSELCLTQFPGV
ncbi:transposable element Tcb1 transposase [Trichonephila clavipes]|nr:transposable element Tcb1 transposase [Trichonephila clavipes]